jgi:hypothetical protein
LKRISDVGRLVSAAVCREKDGELIIEAEEFGSLSIEYRGRIQAIIRAAESYFKGFASDSHRYYLVDHFADTDVRKISPGGMMGHRYFDITELGGSDGLQQDASSIDVAAILKGATYE